MIDGPQNRESVMVANLTPLRAPRPQRRRGRAPRWSIEEIEDAALRLLDAEGFEAVTMRRLAEELGTGVTTLYGYVRTKEEILDGLAGKLLGAIDLDIDRDAQWDDQLYGAVVALHRTLQQHPAIVELLIVPRALSSDAANHAREKLLSILRPAGFGVQEAVDAITTVFSYVFGYTLMELAHARREAPEEQLNGFSALPPSEFPYLAEAAAAWVHRTTDTAFEFGLRHLIDGLRSEVKPARKPSPATRKKAPARSR
jgi:AcrR family transcriptional regulator